LLNIHVFPILTLNKFEGKNRLEVNEHHDMLWCQGAQNCHKLKVINLNPR